MSDSAFRPSDDGACCSFAVHSSIIYKVSMLIDYKGTLFYFTPSTDPRDSDNVICKMNGLSYAELSKKMYEFFSALAFPEKARIVLGGGIISARIVDSIKTMNFRQTERRLFPVQEIRPFLRGIALVENEEQETLLRLFRQAFSANDHYSRLLFYWHTLVYPHTDDNVAVKFIDDHFAELKTLLPRYRDEVEERQFQKGDAEITFGTYLKLGARHSIAHIVRDHRKPYYNLDLDDLKQTWHVSYLADVLEHLCRLKLTKCSKIQIGHREGIVRFLESNPVLDMRSDANSKRHTNLLMKDGAVRTS